MVNAATLSRDAPLIVQPGESFQVTYATSGVPNSNWFVAWNDTISGGCTPAEYNFFLIGTEALDDSKTKLFTAPNSGSCTFSGFYNFTDGGFAYLLEHTVIVNSSSTVTPEIKINEFVSDPNGVGDEWIELFNPTGSVVDLNGWTIEENSGSPFDLSGKSIAANSYLVLEKTVDFTFVLNNPGDNITLKKGVDEVDRVGYGSAVYNAPVAYDGNSTARYPNGGDTDVDNVDFKVMISTKGSENVEASVVVPNITTGSDDLMVNYIRGKVNVNGGVAGSGVPYLVEVIDGPNVGANFSGLVDNEVSGSLLGNGYFDTRDQVAFNTGSRFRVSVDSYDNCSYEGVFENGGNGWFEPEVS